MTLYIPRTECHPPWAPCLARDRMSIMLANTAMKHEKLAVDSVASKTDSLPYLHKCCMSVSTTVNQKLLELPH